MIDRVAMWFGRRSPRVGAVAMAAAVTTAGMGWSLATGRPAAPAVLAVGVIAATMLAWHQLQRLIDYGPWLALRDAGLGVRNLGVRVAAWAIVQAEASEAAARVRQDSVVIASAIRQARTS